MLGEETQFFGLFTFKDLKQLTLLQIIVIVGTSAAAYFAIEVLQNTFKKNPDNIRAAQLLIKRNKSQYPFKTKHLDVPGILKLDVKGLQAGLRAGNFSSVDLVHVFGERCQVIARDLCLSAEENFAEAMKLAE